MCMCMCMCILMQHVHLHRWVGADRPPCCIGRGFAERPRNQLALIKSAMALGGKPLCDFGVFTIGFEDSNCDGVDLLIARTPGCPLSFTLSSSRRPTRPPSPSAQ